MSFYKPRDIWSEISRKKDRFAAYTKDGACKTLVWKTLDSMQQPEQKDIPNIFFFIEQCLMFVSQAIFQRETGCPLYSWDACVVEQLIIT